MDHEIRSLERRALYDEDARAALRRARERAGVEPEYLHVDSDTSLSDLALDELARWDALQIAGLHGDVDYLAVCAQTQLRRLGLGFTDVGQAALAKLSRLTQLEELELYPVSLGSYESLFANIGKLRNLRTLSFTSQISPMPGKLLRHLANLDALRSLRLDSWSPMTAKETPFLAGLRGLKDLQLRQCPISDTGFKPLAKALPALESLTVWSGALQAVAQLCRPPALRELSLRQVRLASAATLAPLRNTDLTRLEILSIPGRADLSEGIAHYLPDTLRALTLRDTTAGLPDLAEACPALEVLDAARSGVRATDLAPELPLRELELDHHPHACESIGRLVRIEELTLQTHAHPLRAEDVEALGLLERLRSLRILGTELPTASSAALARLPQLRSLALNASLDDARLESLIGAPLRSLDLTDLTDGDGVSAVGLTRLLESLPDLEILRLDLRFDDGVFAAIRALPRLRSLTIHGGRGGRDPGLGGLPALAGHPALERLCLFDSPFLDFYVDGAVDALASLPRLTELMTVMDHPDFETAARLRSARPGLRLRQAPRSF